MVNRYEIATHCLEHLVFHTNIKYFNRDGQEDPSMRQWTMELVGIGIAPIYVFNHPTEAEGPLIAEIALGLSNRDFHMPIALHQVIAFKRFLEIALPFFARLKMHPITTPHTIALQELAYATRNPSSHLLQQLKQHWPFFPQGGYAAFSQQVQWGIMHGEGVGLPLDAERAENPGEAETNTLELFLYGLDRRLGKDKYKPYAIIPVAIRPHFRNGQYQKGFPLGAKIDVMIGPPYLGNRLPFIINDSEKRDIDFYQSLDPYFRDVVQKLLTPVSL